MALTLHPFERAPDNVERIEIAGEPAVFVNGDEDAITREVASIDHPAIHARRFMVVGWVRYDHVYGEGHIELLSHVGDQTIVTRALAELPGPMAKLHGAGDWRPFMLPVTWTSKQRPDRLEVNVHLPGKGHVYISDVRLLQQIATTTLPARD